MMTQAQLEARLLVVETTLQELQRRLATLPSAPNWLDEVIGSFKDEPAFDEVIAFGRAFRREDLPMRKEKGWDLTEKRVDQNRQVTTMRAVKIHVSDTEWQVLEQTAQPWGSLSKCLCNPRWLNTWGHSRRCRPLSPLVSGCGLTALRWAMPHSGCMRVAGGTRGLRNVLAPRTLTGDGPMRTIATTAMITAEGTLTVQVPSDIPPGLHRVVLWIDDQPGMPTLRQVHDFPVMHVGAWPADLSLHREDMYGDEGR